MTDDSGDESAPVGFDPDRLARAFRLIDELTRSDENPAAGVCAGRRGGIVGTRLFGRMGPDPDDPPVRPDALFLVASITKPVTVTAVMMLVERGAVSLDDRVAEFVPEFGQNGKGELHGARAEVPSRCNGRCRLRVSQHLSSDSTDVPSRMPGCVFALPRLRDESCCRSFLRPRR